MSPLLVLTTFHGSACFCAAAWRCQSMLAIAPPHSCSLRAGMRIEGDDLSIRLVRAPHECGELRIEARGVLVERRVADPLVDRELGARNRLGRVLRVAGFGIAVQRAMDDQ